MASKNEIYLYGSVGLSFWGEDYFTASMVREQLAEMSGPITVRINSGGGVVNEGQAIFTMLTDYADTVDVIVDGMAASTASLIAMAGKTITMRLGSTMLVHDAASDWTGGRGTEEDHLNTAARLSALSNAVADIYARRAGISREEARAIMKAETFMDGPAAVDAGFATHYDDGIAAAAAAAFDYRIYAHAPAALVDASKGLAREVPKEAVMAMMAGQPRPVLMQAKEGVTMAKESATETAVAGDTSTTVDAVTTETGQGAVAPAVVATASAAPVAADVAERARAGNIAKAVANAGLPATMAADLISSGATEAVALQKITQKWKDGGDMNMASHGRSSAVVTADARDKFIEGATLALLQKGGMKGEHNEFSSMSLGDLARMSLQVAGDTHVSRDRSEMVGRAFTMSGGSHTTSDFSSILQNVANKAMLKGWEEAEETFEQWTVEGVLTDFKPSTRADIGLMNALPVVPEGGEYTYGTIGDRGEVIKLTTRGDIIRISRQVVINDDLNALMKLPMRQAARAKRTIGNLVYAVLTGNPTMSDGKTLFHADHGNLTSTGTALSVAALGVGMAAMRKQKENPSIADSPVLNITARHLIVPVALEMTARQLISSAVDPTANKGMAENPVRGAVNVISDARLDANSAVSWYLAANGAQFDTIEVAYLDGNKTPYIETKDGWTSDGIEMKARIDVGVAPTEYRTLYKNVGA